MGSAVLKGYIGGGADPAAAREGEGVLQGRYPFVYH